MKICNSIAWLFALVSIMPTLAHAQQEETGSVNKDKPAAPRLPHNAPAYKLAVTFIPSSIITPDPTILLGAEYVVSPYMHVAADVGYQFSSSVDLGNEQDQLRGTLGYILRPGIKFFPKGDNGFYIQGQFFYKRSATLSDSWVQSGTQQSPFFALEERKYLRRATGTNMIVGRNISTNIKGFPLWLDVYAGVGIRWKRYGFKGQPLDMPETERGFNILPDIYASGTFLSLPIGIRLMYWF